MESVRKCTFPMLALLLVFILLFAVPNPWGTVAFGTGPVLADSGDSIAISSVSPSTVPGIDAGRTHLLRVEVEYNLESSPSGLITINTFDDTGSKQAKAASEPVAIKSGSGHVMLEMVYAAPWDGVSSIVIAAVLLKDEQTILKWTSSEAIPVNPSADRVAFDQGVVAVQNGNFEEAIPKFTEAISIAPRVANYWQWRGDANARAGHFGDAIKDYTSALEIAPNYRPSVVNRGVSKMWMGDYQAAVADFNIIIEKTPVDGWTGWAYRARGVCNVGLGNRAQAAVDLEMYLKVFPNPRDRELVEGWIAALK